MKHLKTLSVTAMAVIAVMSLPGASTASATMLEVEGWAQNRSVSISASLRTGTSAVFRQKEGFSQNTCTTSELGLSTFAYTPVVEGGVNYLTFWNCSDAITVHRGGQLKIGWSGDTNGAVYSYGMELTLKTVFGTLICKPNAGAIIGTLTGKREWNATIDIKAPLHCGSYSMLDHVLEASYTVTAPLGLGVVK